MHDKQTEKELDLLSDFIKGKKVEMPKLPPKPVKGQSVESKVDLEFGKRIGRAVDSQKTTINLED